MISRTYSCDLCRMTFPSHELGGSSSRLIGIYFEPWPDSIIEKPITEVERHICVKCLCALQAMPKRCGHGYECDGGPKCSSDHK